MPRTDIHAPSNFNPAEYEFRTWFYKGEPNSYAVQEGESIAIRLNERAIEARRLLNESSFNGNFRNRGNCDHCGAHFLWVTVWRHTPTNEHIAVGEICAAERFSLPDRVAFDMKYARDELAQARRRARLVEQCQEFINENPDLAPVLSENGDHPARQDYVVNDIRGYFVRNGLVTEAQANLLRRKMEQAVEREARRREQEGEVKATAPLGRTEFEGVVVKVETKFNDFGERLVMTVKVTETDGVWLAWGTVPNSICRVERGDTVRLTGTLSHGNEPHFAFYKRPGGATIVAKAGENLADSLA